MKRFFKFLGVFFVLLFFIGLFSEKDETKTTKPATKVEPVEDYSVKDLIDYKIIKRDEMGTAKKSFDLRVDLIDGRLPTKKELGDVSKHLRSINTQYDRVFVSFFLPDMQPGDGAFAIAHHQPDKKMKVEVLDYMLPEKYRKLVTEK
jgi:hypothetical protein